MKKNSIKLWIGLLLMMVFLPLSCMAEGLEKYEYTHNGYQATMLKKHWDSFDHTHCGFDTPEDFLRYAVDAMERIIAWGGSTKKLDEYRAAGSEVILTVQFTTTDKASHVVNANYGKTKQQAVITLKDVFLASYMAPVVHELTHVIYPVTYSRTLREGLATYAQETLEEYETIFNFGMNPHEIVQNVIVPAESNQNLLGVVGSTTAGKSAASEQRAAFYVVSQSFMTYLIETYGIETSMKIYKGDGNDVYVEQIGKTLEETQRDWLEYLKRYESDFTAEMYRDSAYDTMIARGMPKAAAQGLSQAQYASLMD